MGKPTSAMNESDCKAAEVSSETKVQTFNLLNLLLTCWTCWTPHVVIIHATAVLDDSSYGTFTNDEVDTIACILTILKEIFLT